MKTNLSEIVLLVDRSGSMSRIRDDMEQGLAEFIQKQKELPGECVVTSYTFDSLLEKQFEKQPIQNIAKVVIQPRGSTALIDALAKTINEVGVRLSNTTESERPAQVIFIVITDGEENSSREFKIEKVKEMVKHQQNVYKWNFIFLGSNIDAISTGDTYGFLSAASMTYESSSKGVRAMAGNLSDITACYRSGDTAAAFSDEARNASVQK